MTWIVTALLLLPRPAGTRDDVGKESADLRRENGTLRKALADMDATTRS